MSNPDFIVPDFQQGIDIGMGHSVALPCLVLEVGEMVACFYDMENPSTPVPNQISPAWSSIGTQRPIVGWDKRSEPFR
ncbi:MAG: hypothetical protein H6573_20470 [Lewinellaceae bacterium]|nr:hypothetical protein [Lewinellaceae bacterium]